MAGNHFRAPWGLRLEPVCSPQRLGYARTGGEWMWRPSKNGKGEHTT